MEIEYIKSNAEPFKNTQLIEYIIQTGRGWYNEDKYKSQYGHELSFIYFAKSNNEIVGTQGMIFYPLIFNNIKILSSKSETTFLSENYRGKKIFENLYSSCMSTCKKQNISFVWGFTKLKNVWEKKLNFKSSDSIILEGYLNLGYDSNVLKLLRNKYLSMMLDLFSIKNNKSFNKLSIEIMDVTIDNIHLFATSNLNQIAIDYQNQYFFESRIKSRGYQIAKIKIENNWVNFIFKMEGSSLIISDLQFSDSKNLDICLIKLIKQTKSKTITFFVNKHIAAYESLINAYKKIGGKVLSNQSMIFVYFNINDKSSDLTKIRINEIWKE